jgi:5'-3' exonuclease
MKRYLLIDGPNMLHAANNAKKLTVGTTEVTAIYNFIRMLRPLIATYPTATPVVLWDGASWRHMKFPDYKQNRKKDDTAAAVKQREAYESAMKQLPAIKKALELMGIAQVKATNMEADDLAAILGDRYVSQGAKVVLVSGDKDWIQLVGPSMIWFDPIKDRKIMKPEDVEPAIGLVVESWATLAITSAAWAASAIRERWSFWRNTSRSRTSRRWSWIRPSTWRSCPRRSATSPRARKSR